MFTLLRLWEMSCMHLLYPRNHYTSYNSYSSWRAHLGSIPFSLHSYVKHCYCMVIHACQAFVTSWLTWLCMTLALYLHLSTLDLSVVLDFLCLPMLPCGLLAYFYVKIFGFWLGYFCLFVINFCEQLSQYLFCILLCLYRIGKTLQVTPW